MRWEGLFADLEGQLAAEQRRERDDEVAERTRRERALVTLPARLAAAVGGPLRIILVGGRQVDGDLEDLGEDWVLVRMPVDAHEVLMPLAAVVISLVGDGPRLLGTIDAVGADHLDLAEHPDGLPRRRENVRAVATVPFAALIAVESRR